MVMSQSLSEQTRERGQGGSLSFDSLHWSVVKRAGLDTTFNYQDALERLCRSYWYPLYSFVRRQGYDPSEAQDLTQEFFSRPLRDRARFSTLDPSKGRFRSFLI